MKVSLRVSLAIVAGMFLIVGASTVPALGQAAGGAQSSQKPSQGQSSQQPSQQGQSGQSGQTPAAPAVSAAESQAYQDVVSEATAGLDPDKVISLSEAFAKSYPASLLLTAVYSAEASAYVSKGDAVNAVSASEKSLKLNGDNLASLLLLSETLPQPQVLQGSDADKLKKLDEAEAVAKHALDLIGQNKVPRAPNEADDAYKKRKDDISADPHAALGMVHLERATMGLAGLDQGELTKAAQEFKQSVDMTDRPAPEHYYRLGEVYKIQSKIDDALAAFSRASELSQGTGLQPLADQQVAALKKVKDAQAKPAGAH